MIHVRDFSMRLFLVFRKLNNPPILNLFHHLKLHYLPLAHVLSWESAFQIGLEAARGNNFYCKIFADGAGICDIEVIGVTFTVLPSAYIKNQSPALRLLWYFLLISR